METWSDTEEIDDPTKAAPSPERHRATIGSAPRSAEHGLGNLVPDTVLRSTNSSPGEAIIYTLDYKQGIPTTTCWPMLTRGDESSSFRHRLGIQPVQHQLHNLPLGGVFFCLERGGQRLDRHRSPLRPARGGERCGAALWVGDFHLIEQDLRASRAISIATAMIHESRWGQVDLACHHGVLLTAPCVG